MDATSLSWEKSGQGGALTTQPHQVLRLKSRAIPLYSPSESSQPVLGQTLLFKYNTEVFHSFRHSYFWTCRECFRHSLIYVYDPSWHVISNAKLEHIINYSNHMQCYVQASCAHKVQSSNLTPATPWPASLTAVCYFPHTLYKTARFSTSNHSTTVSFHTTSNFSHTSHTAIPSSAIQKIPVCHPVLPWL